MSLNASWRFSSPWWNGLRKASVSEVMEVGPEPITQATDSCRAVVPSEWWYLLPPKRKSIR